MCNYRDEITLWMLSESKGCSYYIGKKLPGRKTFLLINCYGRKKVTMTSILTLKFYFTLNIKYHSFFCARQLNSCLTFTKNMFEIIRASDVVDAALPWNTEGTPEEHAHFLLKVQ